jgi:hypothetical protein
MTRRGRRPKSLPAGRAIGWWIAGFEERMYPGRETVEERVRWGTESRASSGPGSDIVVRFPDGPGPRVSGSEPVPATGPADEGPAGVGALESDESAADRA